MKEKITRKVLKALGIYAYSVKALREFCSLSSSALERAEKLEQLRAIENGKNQNA